MFKKFIALSVSLIALAASPAWAQTAAPTLNSGDTAWMLTSSLLVLMMSIPGLALFYGGLVRSKNVLSVLMQCFAIVSLITVLWLVYGYSLAFSTQGMEAGVINLNSFIGGFDKVMLFSVGRDSLFATIPESVFAMFLLTFAAITASLTGGSVS